MRWSSVVPQHLTGSMPRGSASRNPARQHAVASNTPITCTNVPGSLGAMSNSTACICRVEQTTPDAPDDHAGRGEQHSLTHDEPKHGAWRRAERDADADLLLALRHGERQQTIDTERPEQQTNHAENPEQPGE